MRKFTLHYILVLTFLFGINKLAFSDENNSDAKNQFSKVFSDEMAHYLKKISESNSFSKEEAKRVCEKLSEIVKIISENGSKLSQEILIASKELILNLARQAYQATEEQVIKIIEQVEKINENIRNYLKQENHTQSLEQAVKNILTQHKNLILSTIGLVVTVFYLTQKNVAG